MKPFVQCMNKLANNGIERIIKIFCLVCFVDSVARAPMQGLTQYNGHYGCNWCLHPGKWVVRDDNPNSGSLKYPLLDEIVRCRNESDSYNHMLEGTERKPCFGFKYPPQLINLKNFNIIDGFIPDHMHVISGIGELFANMWFGTRKISLAFVDADTVKKINDILTSIKAPHQIGRLTRSLQDKEFWKAREWENWTLYYSTIVLKFFFDRRYVLHWIKLVEALYILLQTEITIMELNRADCLLHQFVAETEDLYSQFSMTYNVHILLHLSKSVLNWGPLFAHSAFAFESGNCQLLKTIHAAKGVHHQMCRNINLHEGYAILYEIFYKHTSTDVQNFCSQLGTSRIKNTIKLNDSRYFGIWSNVKPMWLEQLHLSSQARSYQKVVKENCLYSSSLKINKRSDNTYAKLIDDTYVKIKEFIVDPRSNQEFLIYQKLRTRDAFRNEYKALQRILSTNCQETSVATVNLHKICIHMIFEREEYICALPNLYSYECSTV